MTYQPDDGRALRSDGAPSAYDQVRKYGPSTILAIAALLFVVQNDDKTQFSFLWFDFTTYLWLILLISMVVGAIVFWGAARRRRKRAEQ